jgi:hypothetical protein
MSTLSHWVLVQQSLTNELCAALKYQVAIWLSAIVCLLGTFAMPVWSKAPQG